MSKSITVVGGGLAGSEAAQMIARLGHPVDLFEMRPVRKTPAHQLEGLAELVCSNSLGSDDPQSAAGLLKEEMRLLGSVILSAAQEAAVPAGRALAVDRGLLSDHVTQAIALTPTITLQRQEVTQFPSDGLTVMATGPLTSDPLAEALAGRLGKPSLYFYDAISPIVSADSIDLSVAYFASRYDADSDDYLNCPMDRLQYENFVAEILKAEKVAVRAFEEMKCFESCMPIEVLAERGLETLAFGPMKPIGLINPKTGKRPHAVVQLRRENMPTTMYNLVGFQSRMKWGEQKRIFRMIPGLEKAEFVRYGSLHRNTYVDAPKVLASDLSLQADHSIFLAGQITGVEGYVESAAIGQLVGLFCVARQRGLTLPKPPRETALGSLLSYITQGPLHGHFAPMNISFGLLPELGTPEKSKTLRRQRILKRAREAFDTWRQELAKVLGDLYFARPRPLLESEADGEDRNPPMSATVY